MGTQPEPAPSPASFRMRGGSKRGGGGGHTAPLRGCPIAPTHPQDAAVWGTAFVALLGTMQEDEEGEGGGGRVTPMLSQPFLGWVEPRI